MELALVLLKKFWPYIVAAALGAAISGKVVWSIQQFRIDSAKRDTAKVEADFEQYKIELKRVADKQREDAENEAKNKESQWKAQLAAEQTRSTDQIEKRDRAYASAVRTINELRGSVTNINNSLSAITPAACSARIAALSTVSNECAEELTEMGRAAQGQFIDAVACREAWPR